MDKFQIFRNIFILRLTKKLIYIQKAQYISLCLLFLFLPFSKGLSNTFAYITILITILNIYVYNYKKCLLPIKYLNFSAAIALIYLISIVWSENWEEGINFMKNKFLLLLIPLFFVEQSEEKIIRLTTLFSYTLFVATILIFLCNIIPDKNLELYSHRFPHLLNPYIPYDKKLFGIYSPFIERIQWGNIVGIACILNIYYYLKYKKKKLLLFSIILAITIILSGSRGTWIALVMVALYAIATYPSTWKYKILYIIILISTLSVTYQISFVQKRILQAQYEYNMVFKEHKLGGIENYSSIRRLVSWQNSFTLIKNNWLIGTGIGDYSNKYQDVYQSNNNFNLPVNNHSQWLHIIGSTGIVGLLFVLCFLIYGYKISENKNLYFIISIFYSTVFIFDAILLQTTDCILFAIMYSTLFHGNKTKYITS